MSRRHRRDRQRDEYGQSWEMAAALWDGPRTIDEIVDHFRSYVRFLGLFSVTDRLERHDRAVRMVAFVREFIMSNTKSTQSGDPKPRLERSGIGRLIQVFVSALIIGALLFLSAGRLDWPEAWIFSSLYLTYLLALMVWGLGRDPDLMNERGKRADNVEGWDKVLMAIYAPILFIMPVIAGLDAGRFGWSTMPFALQVVGLVGLIPAMAMPWWAMSANTYLSAVVRIQDDRGHQVVTTGPYQYVRHPTYVGTILFGLCTPLFLGSWWALIPGGLIAILFVIRTALEDRTLRDELPGYAGYAERVRYRLLPGVW